MFFKVIIIIAAFAFASIQCKQSYIIKGSGWKNDLEKCASGGDENRTFNFNIGTLDSSVPGLNYNDIKQSTAADAHGYLELLTSTGSEVKQTLHLTEYYQGDDYKQFSENWSRATTSGLASQASAISLTLKIHREGLIELINNVYAGSWLAITCATTKAYVDTIEIIN